MSAPRVGHCVFSDDIRHEVGGKISLIGIYRGDIIFPTSPPIIYPKLCASVWLIAEPDDIPNEIHVSVLAPDQTEIARLDIQDMDAVFSDSPSLMAYVSSTATGASGIGLTVIVTVAGDVSNSSSLAV